MNEPRMRVMAINLGGLLEELMGRRRPIGVPEEQREKTESDYEWEAQTTKLSNAFNDRMLDHGFDHATDLINAAEEAGRFEARHINGFRNELKFLRGEHRDCGTIRQHVEELFAEICNATTEGLDQAVRANPELERFFGPAPQIIEMQDGSTLHTNPEHEDGREVRPAIRVSELSEEVEGVGAQTGPRRLSARDRRRALPSG